MKSRKQAVKSKKAAKGNSRIKQVGETHWVLHKQSDVRKYRGFKSKAEAEQFAASTPVEKKVRITAEREKAATAKKAGKARPKPKKYSRPEIRVVGLETVRNDGKVVRFSDGQKKYRPERREK